MQFSGDAIHIFDKLLKDRAFLTNPFSIIMTFLPIIPGSMAPFEKTVAVINPGFNSLKRTCQMKLSHKAAIITMIFEDL